MRRKIISIILVVTMCMTSIVIMPQNIKVKADPGEEGYNNIDTSVVYSVCQNLSNVIFDAYDEGELRKGREFGSKGEKYAADYIYNYLYDLGLSPIKERIQTYPTNSIDDKLDVLERGLKFNGNPVECYISPRWNNTLLDPLYNKNLLSYNFSYSGLKVVRRPSFWISDFMANIIEDLNFEIEEEYSITDIESFLNYIVTKFENVNNIDFNELNQEEAELKFPWFNELMDNVSGEDFVLIEEDPFNNPNPNQDFSPGTLWKFAFQNPLSIPRIWYVIGVLTIQILILKCCNNFKGMTLYDFNNDVHDMVALKNIPVPILFINGTEGQPIYNNPDDYTVDFYINQYYNDSVESYNVISTIPGQDNSRTFIVSSLMDSWWNQGSADSAIGCGLMLASCIVPVLNLR